MRLFAMVAFILLSACHTPGQTYTIKTIAGGECRRVDLA